MHRIFGSSAPFQILRERRLWRDWDRHKCRRAGTDRLARSEIEVDFSKFNPEDYLLYWTTAVAGVEVEDDGHTIVTPHNKFINDNGNSWSNRVLIESYHTFILAENYVEHISLPELSKGKVLDAVAWVYEKQYTGYREPVPTIFIDTLLATNRKKHPKLVRNIERGILNACSMGCDILFSQCSRCGRIIEEGKDEPCTHIKNQLGRTYYNPKNKKRRVSELCGVPGKLGSCIFKELSLVARPAFAWAKIHGFVQLANRSTGKPMRAFIPSSRWRESNKES